MTLVYIHIAKLFIACVNTCICHPYCGVVTAMSTEAQLSERVIQDHRRI